MAASETVEKELERLHKAIADEIIRSENLDFDKMLWWAFCPYCMVGPHLPNEIDHKKHCCYGASRYEPTQILSHLVKYLDAQWMKPRLEELSKEALLQWSLDTFSSNNRKIYEEVFRHIAAKQVPLEMVLEAMEAMKVAEEPNNNDPAMEHFQDENDDGAIATGG